MSAKKYTTGIISKLEELFKSTLHCDNSPMDASYHPELNESAFIGEEEHSRYQILIGSAQWAITLVRFNIAYATNTLARYSALPRKGHLEALLRVFRYLKKTKHAKILFDPREPNYSSFTCAAHEWDGEYPKCP